MSGPYKNTDQMKHFRKCRCIWKLSFLLNNSFFNFVNCFFYIIFCLILFHHKGSKFDKRSDLLNVHTIDVKFQSLKISQCVVLWDQYWFGFARIDLQPIFQTFSGWLLPASILGFQYCLQLTQHHLSIWDDWFFCHLLGWQYFPAHLCIVWRSIQITCWIAKQICCTFLQILK